MEWLIILIGIVILFAILFAIFGGARKGSGCEYHKSPDEEPPEPPPPMFRS